MESSIRTSKQKAVKKVIANAYDNMAVEELGMPEKSQVARSERKDMEKLCPEITFTRNVRPLCGKNALILVLTLITLVSVTVNILQLTRSNMHFDCSLCEDISTFQTNDGATGSIMRANDGATGDIKRTTFESECADTPCENGATCHESFTCDCMPGYEGDLCETDIDECASQPCWNGATCIDDLDFFMCLCVPGYEGILCETDTNECASEPCLHGGTCHDEVDDFRCECMPGYEGIVCQIDIDECLSEPCLNGGTCDDGANSFICDCMPGYEGTLCQADIDECASIPCLNGGTCHDGIDFFICVCMPGYTGTLCEIDIDECVSKPCLNGGTCYDGIDDFLCECMPGYEGTRCETEVDECASSPCQNGGTCNDDFKSYWCSCDIGYTGTHCEVQSYLVMLGGESTSDYEFSACDVYELSGSSSDEVTIPPLPEALEDAAVIDTDDSIYIIGGRRDGTIITDTTYKLTKSTKNWIMLSSMHEVREYHTAVEVNNKIVAVGGYVSGYSSSVEIYDVATNIWRNLDQDSDYPIGVRYHASCSWRNEVYVSGGYNGNTGTQAGVYRFSLETERWTWFADLVHARYYHSMVVVDDQLYVLDGADTQQIEMYDESTGRFTVTANSPLSIYRTNAVVLDSYIITAGGYHNDKMVVLDTVTRNFTIRDMDLRREYWQSHVAMITITNEK